jgi:hypothetical protein
MERFNLNRLFETKKIVSFHSGNFLNMNGVLILEGLTREGHGWLLCDNSESLKKNKRNDFKYSLFSPENGEDLPETIENLFNNRRWESNDKKLEFVFHPTIDKNGFNIVGKSEHDPIYGKFMIQQKRKVKGIFWFVKEVDSEMEMIQTMHAKNILENEKNKKKILEQKYLDEMSNKRRERENKIYEQKKKKNNEVMIQKILSDKEQREKEEHQKEEERRNRLIKEDEQKSSSTSNNVIPFHHTHAYDTEWEEMMRQSRKK